jgi:hypothetical protein
MTMADDQSALSKTISRRVVLTSGVSCALTLAIPQYVLSFPSHPATAVAGSAPDERRPNLYVFPGSRPGRTTIAATWPILSRLSSELRLHVGEHSVSIPVAKDSSDSSRWDDNGRELFSGDLLLRTAERDLRVKGIVVELPSDMFAKEGFTNIWAERISSGARLRFGSPFLADIIAKDSRAASLYHASSPHLDDEVLNGIVAAAVTRNAQSSGYVGNAQKYGRRVASALLPDVMRYNPNLPVGFTFAGQNGRHPNDAAQSVVTAVVSGVLAYTPNAPRLRLNQQFPYFPQPPVRA